MESKSEPSAPNVGLLPPGKTSYVYNIVVMIAIISVYLVLPPDKVYINVLGTPAVLFYLRFYEITFIYECIQNIITEIKT